MSALPEQQGRPVPLGRLDLPEQQAPLGRLDLPELQAPQVPQVLQALQVPPGLLAPQEQTALPIRLP